MAAITMKKGDRFPSFETTLSDNAGAIDLTDCTVQFRMSLPGAAGTLLQAAAVVVYPAEQADPLKRGKVRYDWQVGDTDATGVHNAEWRVTRLDGRKFTVPRGPGQTFDTVTIQDEVV